MKNILSRIMVGVAITFLIGCGDSSKPIVTMPDTSAGPKRVGESEIKTGVSNDKLEAPAPGK